MALGKKTLRISFNSPVILGFVLLCFAAWGLDVMTGGLANRLVFSVYRSSLSSLFTYIRFFGHVIGHGSWGHLMGNMTLLLVVGPLLEEKYGSMAILKLILVTAFVTGLVHFIFFPRTMLLGASGVVFAFILLSSFASIRDGKIPLTFILVAVIYIGEEVVNGIFVQDNVSNLTHILGGVVGACSGYSMNRRKGTYF